VTAVTDPDTNTTSTAYDRAGNQIVSTDPLGRVTVTTFGGVAELSASFVSRQGHSKRPAPPGGSPGAGAPPVANSQSRLAADRAGQLFVDEDAGAAPVRAEGAAPRPRDAAGAGAGYDHVAVTGEARGPVATTKGRMKPGGRR